MLIRCRPSELVYTSSASRSVDQWSVVAWGMPVMTIGLEGPSVQWMDHSVRTSCCGSPTEWFGQCWHVMPTPCSETLSLPTGRQWACAFGQTGTGTGVTLGEQEGNFSRKFCMLMSTILCCTWPCYTKNQTAQVKVSELEMLHSKVLCVYVCARACLSVVIN